MIRITRVVSKDRLTDLLNLKFVYKVENKQVEQGFNNISICRANIYLEVKPYIYFFQEMNIILKWVKKNNLKNVESIIRAALQNKFIKESAFDDFDYPMPNRYKKLCNLYSKEYFNLFNKREI